ncbi:MAG: tetratricopeptide repeat-containing glycosyltransferase family protein, partial [Pirellulales bacterium]
YPSHAETLHLFGLIAIQQGRYADAMASIGQAIAVNPRRASFYSNLGEAHRGLGQLAEAVDCCQRAIRLEPNLSEAHNNLGLALRTQGDVAGATRQFERAVELKHDNVNAHFNLACILLLQGDFQRGLREYAWRMQMPWHPSRELSIPPWDGSPLVGKRLLLYAEQGLGDTMQFIRYLPLIHRRAAEVTTIVQGELLPLLPRSGFQGLLPRGAPTPPCDAQCPLVSLPELLATTPQTIPADVPYLRADPQLVEHWRAQLDGISGFKVGIAWQGSKTYMLDRYRSIPPAAFEPLATVGGVRLISLQVGEETRQLDALAGRFEVLRFLDRFDAEHGAFMDTAAVMMNLDLVVTSDTAIAHLAGALGVPVWVALCAAPDWRWMLNRPDSPWYPTMRLFRQSVLGQWSDVFAAIAAAIMERRPTEGERDGKR